MKTLPRFWNEVDLVSLIYISRLNWTTLTPVLTSSIYVPTESFSRSYIHTSSSFITTTSHTTGATKSPSVSHLHLFGGFRRSLPRPIILLIILIPSLLTALFTLGSHRRSSTLLLLCLRWCWWFLIRWCRRVLVAAGGTSRDSAHFRDPVCQRFGRDAYGKWCCVSLVKRAEIYPFFSKEKEKVYFQEQRAIWWTWSIGGKKLTVPHSFCKLLVVWANLVDLK